MYLMKLQRDIRFFYKLSATALLYFNLSIHIPLAFNLCNRNTYSFQNRVTFILLFYTQEGWGHPKREQLRAPPFWRNLQQLMSL